MSEKTKPYQWTIQARAFKLPLTPFAHNFWALVDSKGRVADQIHGLAVDPSTGETKALGTSRHLLQAIHDPAILWSLQPGQAATVCATGPEKEVRRRWQAALNAIPAINALKLPYPNLWQHFYKRNSNSVFSTLGLIMGFDEPAQLLPHLAPGVKLVISRDIIARYRYTAGALESIFPAAGRVTGRKDTQPEPKK